MENFKKQESLKPYFEQSYGCAAFPSVAKGGLFFVGGAFGAGTLHTLEDGAPSDPVGKVELVQAAAGWILGGEVYSELIFFETDGDYKRFVAGNFEFSGEAKAVALTAAIGAKASTMGNHGVQGGVTADETVVKGIDPFASKPEYTKGMKVFTLSLGGMMYQATISGQKFNIKM